MKKIFFCFLILVNTHLNAQVKVVSDQDLINKNPEITFDIDSVHLGTLVKGEKAALEFPFTNTGDADLIIELVTTCKCTSIQWPKEPLKPGDRGVITAIYDTSDQKLGKVKKTLDIISNTDPMLVETKFTAEVIE